MLRYRSWPAVSHIWAFTSLLSSICTVFVANSTPIVDFESLLNSFFVKRNTKFDFPTPESPRRTILKMNCKEVVDTKIRMEQWLFHTHVLRSEIKSMTRRTPPNQTRGRFFFTSAETLHGGEYTIAYTHRTAHVMTVKNVNTVLSCRVISLFFRSQLLSCPIKFWFVSFEESND